MPCSCLHAFSQESHHELLSSLSVTFSCRFSIKHCVQLRSFALSLYANLCQGTGIYVVIQMEANDNINATTFTAQQPCALNSSRSTAHSGMERCNFFPPPLHFSMHTKCTRQELIVSHVSPYDSSLSWNV